jgi:hypothetical protein
MDKLFLQPFTGISGDMFLAGLSDLGLDLSPLTQIFAAAGLDIEIDPKLVRRQGLVGRQLELDSTGQQPLRHEAELLDLVRRLDLSLEVRKRSCRAISRLAEVEAMVHGCDREEIHFHEVGAVDTVVDIVGAFWGLEQLGIASVHCAPLPWFGGQVSCEHGLLPLPAPATVQLLRGKPLFHSGLCEELVTPTGALLVDQLVDSFGELPSGTLLYSGQGWGSRELKDRPNILRLFIVQSQSPVGGLEEVWILEANIDHLTGEELGSLFEVFIEHQALDVIYIPGVMKKNRPGGLLQVLSAPQDLARLQELFIAHSLTLGLRRRRCERLIVPRQGTQIETNWGPLAAKEAYSGDQAWVRPEFEALSELARKTGRSVAQLRTMLGLKGQGRD